MDPRRPLCKLCAEVRHFQPQYRKRGFFSLNLAGVCPEWGWGASFSKKIRELKKNKPGREKETGLLKGLEITRTGFLKWKLAQRRASRRDLACVFVQKKDRHEEKLLKTL